MIQIRKSHERGKTQTEWLDSYHSFSFGDYYDPQFQGFGDLVVINEDVVKPATGFGLHSHHNMEIITYIVNGALQHQDSMGQSLILQRGEIQRMSAGTGIRHSEVNPSQDDSVHLLQIWIRPREIGLTPSYEQISISQKENTFNLIGSPQGNEESVIIHQDVRLYVAYLKANSAIDYELAPHHYAWLQLISGEISLNGEVMFAGDGAAISNESLLTIKSELQSEFLFFDFAKN